MDDRSAAPTAPLPTLVGGDTTIVEPEGRGRRTATSGPEFVALLSMVMALAALGIDMILPAFDEIRAAFGLSADSNAVARLVTAYFLGMALGPIPYGALSDRLGRRPVLWLSGSIYIVGVAITALAPTFGVLLIGRFIWGLGAGGGRVVALAILRDTHEGALMARTMSFIMAVFVLVPILAPSLGALIISVAPWQAAFWAAGIGAALLLLWSLRLPETLPTEPRRTERSATIASTARRMAGTVTIAAPVLAITALMAIMTSWLGSSELIISEQFGWGDRFPQVFGATAAVLGLTSLVNGRLLGRLSIEQIIGPVSRIYLVLTLVLFGVVAATGGTPGFWIFMPLLTAALACQMFLMPALNTLALAPMADAAGTASALVATVSTALAAMVGALVDSQYDGTVTPLAVALVATGSVVAALVALTLNRSAG